jgi:ASC-1-like (ASCH) protein
MKLIESEFNNIKYNGKIIEIRLNDEKSRDKIIFYKLPYMKESILVTVEQVYIFTSFSKAYAYFPKTCFGYENMSTEEIIKNIYLIYTEEQERSRGVMAIKFNVENQSLLKI